jgi:hypothetical protein
MTPPPGTLTGSESSYAPSQAAPESGYPMTGGYNFNAQLKGDNSRINFMPQKSLPPSQEAELKNTSLPSSAPVGNRVNLSAQPFDYNEQMMQGLSGKLPADLKDPLSGRFESIRKNYAQGGMPMAQWGFANPVDMTMLGISNTKPEIYADAKLKKDWSAAAPMIPGAISNFTQGMNVAKNQKAIEQAQREMYDPAGKFAQATTGNKGIEEINTQAFMPDRSMDSPFQTSAYSARIGAYGGVFDDGGAYEEGEEYELSDDQIRALEEQGYVLKY